jgi:hypothetical protein
MSAVEHPMRWCWCAVSVLPATKATSLPTLGSASYSPNRSRVSRTRVGSPARSAAASQSADSWRRRRAGEVSTRVRSVANRPS